MSACKTCAFRDPDPRPDYEGAGHCRRYPPVLNVTADTMGDPTFHQYWPWMHATDWCGEYRDSDTHPQGEDGTASFMGSAGPSGHRP